MRKNKKKSFDELVLENKQQLLQDQEALERIEERWEQRILEKLD
ncbi:MULTISPECIES: FbpB family small basic protein [Metabacillus]|uniref:FbpB family small basic protein n=1 Tax=Metabacillus rhizolycopersici TaxID=2875709 RepID=A0ABS7UVB5_9BACI|nr:MULTISPECIES: FbpB family small basic protein [Metabacillus]MBZ5752257.1 FbpB family small basic protein [Metabacillus rhizolycopersici]MCM3653617.1 FbpB family small basic protein [Metabacillus litoralis]